MSRTEVLETALIGAYTEHMSHVEGHALGISFAALDAPPMSFGLQKLGAVVRNPAWVTVSSDGSRVYAVSEVDEDEGERTGRVHAFSWRGGDEYLAPINSVSSEGESPTHLALDPTGRFLVVATFNSGTVSAFQLDENGGLSRATDTVQHTGFGHDPVRQAEPHPHQIVFDPLTGELLVPDLGLDQVLRYRLEAGGNLVPAAVPIELPRGSGPRHLAFGPGAESLLVLGELDSTVCVLTRLPDGGFEQKARLSTLPADYSGPNLTAGFVATTDGRTAFASNRGHDSVAMFGWDDAEGQLTLDAVFPCGGREPRALALTRDERHLVVANQNSDELVLFALGEGGPTIVDRLSTPSPACVMFSDPRRSG